MFSGVSCIQSSMLELGHFIIFFTIDLESLSLILRVSNLIQDARCLKGMPISSCTEFSTTCAGRRYCVIDDSFLLVTNPARKLLSWLTCTHLQHPAKEAKEITKVRAPSLQCEPAAPGNGSNEN